MSPTRFTVTLHLLAVSKKEESQKPFCEKNGKSSYLLLEEAEKDTIEWESAAHIYLFGCSASPLYLMRVCGLTTSHLFDSILENDLEEA
jgi:hypothetical protein